MVDIEQSDKGAKADGEAERICENYVEGLPLTPEEKLAVKTHCVIKLKEQPLAQRTVIQDTCTTSLQDPAAFDQCVAHKTLNPGSPWQVDDLVKAPDATAECEVESLKAPNTRVEQDFRRKCYGALLDASPPNRRPPTDQNALPTKKARRILDLERMVLDLIQDDLGIVRRQGKGVRVGTPETTPAVQGDAMRSSNDEKRAIKQNLTEKEIEFYNKVLKRGEKEGVWIINKFILGGNLSKKGAMGFDFEVQNQKNGVIMKIEFKQGANIILTPSQFKRFKYGTDTPKNLTRLCFIQPYSRKDPEFVSKVVCLSPKFFQTLPDDLFIHQDSTHILLRWQGLENYLNHNGVHLLFEVKNNREFGDFSARRFKPISKDKAFDWLYLQLCDTIKGQLNAEKEDLGAHGPITPINNNKINQLIKTSLINQLSIHQDFFDSLQPLEKKFAEHVLMRGEGEEQWQVDRFNSAGALTKCGETGIDFKLQDQRTGNLIEIEFKQNTTIVLTGAQFKRFKYSEDTQKSALRLCLIQPTKSSPNSAIKVLYLSPKFFQALPDTLFHFSPKDPNHISLHWKELENFLMQNRENMYFDVIGGEFGASGANYKPIPINKAYDWLYKKLCATMENPLEDLKKNSQEDLKKSYSKIEIEIAIPEKISNLVLDSLSNSYRPLYAIEFIPLIKKHFPDIIREENGRCFIMKERANAYLGKLMRNLVRKRIGVISVRNEEDNGAYGLEAHSGSYIALSLSASRFLDKLKRCREMTGKDEFTIDDISKVINENYRNIKSNYDRGYFGLLAEGMFEMVSSYPIKIKLTPKCINYFTRTENKSS